MKIKKMKLLSLFFVLASVVAVKTSLNPICVRAMKAAQPNFSYGFAGVEEFKDVKFINGEAFDRIKQKTENFYKQQGKDLDVTTEQKNINSNNYNYTIQLPGSNTHASLEDCDNIIFYFYDNNLKKTGFKTNIKDIAQNSAILLGDWLYKLTKDERFIKNRWNVNDKNLLVDVRSVLEEYLYDKNFQHFTTHNYNDDFFISISFDKNKKNIRMHYFYKLYTDNLSKLVYLGSVNYPGNGEKVIYEDEQEALNSYLFRCFKFNSCVDFFR